MILEQVLEASYSHSCHLKLKFIASNPQFIYKWKQREKIENRENKNLNFFPRQIREEKGPYSRGRNHSHQTLSPTKIQFRPLSIFIFYLWWNRVQGLEVSGAFFSVWHDLHQKAPLFFVILSFSVYVRLLDRSFKSHIVYIKSIGLMRQRNFFL